MPRVYVRKRETKYTLMDLRKAVNDVQQHKKTYRQAEETYKVPISVIYHRIKGRKIDINRMGAGVAKVLPDTAENYIVTCLETRAQMGHPVIKVELNNLVKEYIECKGIVNNFKNNKPGNDWYMQFMKRHPKLTLKKPEHLQKLRMDARKPYIIYDFYKMLKDMIQENSLVDKPMYIYNCDESGFQSDPSKLRAIGHKGKALYRISGGSGRESTTVLACVSADGRVLPPVIVFKGAAVQARWTSEKSFPGTLYAASKNGWMEEPIFFNWLIKSFIPYVTKLREERNEPGQRALLLYDGHTSHISVRITEEANNANIILMKFPSHLTDRIQPLDKCVFGPVKKAWESKLVEHGIHQMGKGTGRLTRPQFGELLGEVYTIAFKTENIISGFKSTGLYPVNPSNFSKNFFNIDDLKLYNILLDNEKTNSIEFNEDERQGELFQLNNSVEPEIEVQPELGLGMTKSNDKTNIIEINEDEKQGERLQLDDSVGLEIEIQPEMEFGMTTLDPIIRHDIETQQPKIKTANRNFQELSMEQQTYEPNIEIIEINEQRKEQITEKSNSLISSSLLNNILKQISLDKQTNNEIKEKMVNALLSTVLNEENKLKETISPNKEALERIFRVSFSTPEKKKKVVIPRLKQSAFGEVLTSQEVMGRLKEAENKKKQTKKSQIEKLCKNKVKDITNTEKTQSKQRKRKVSVRKTTTKKLKMKVTNKRRKVNLVDTSNSEIDMSIHSDSDIDDVASDATRMTVSPLTVFPSESKQKIVSKTNETCNVLNDLGKACRSPVPGSSRPHDDNAEYIEYKENDTVLVRYISKKKVEYFVGKILTKTKNRIYTVLFFKKIGRNDNTRFITATKDIDNVPANMIVKTVNLLSLNDTEFVLFDEDDYVYFS